MWLDKLKTNPLELLLSTGNPTLLFFIERDLLDKVSEPVQILWEQHEPTRLIAKQEMVDHASTTSSPTRLRSKPSEQQSDAAWMYHSTQP